MNTFGAKSSTCGNVNDVVAGGRKATQTIAASETEEAVLVSLGRDDAVVFSDEVEVESVPSLETDEEDDEEEEEWGSDEEEEEEEYDEEDAELDEGLAERLRILADARALKTLAVAFLHPEKPVEVSDPAVYGRNYFERASAPEQQEDEDADEEADILADALALKEAARAYLHPEEGVTGSAPESFGRNYFDRPSAPEVEDADEAEERARVLEEVAALKQSAKDYMHPEVGVTTTDGACFGRSYFNRYSAPETEEDELADERAEILAEAAALKKSAADYMHPEVGVTSADGACFGRNYFNRASAPETEEDEDAAELAEILAEAAALKKSAADYMHPEVGVTSAGGACYGRNYFNRYSSPETEEDELAAERAKILAEAAALKKSAADYMHPEVGVTSADCACFGRNYFNRYSAPETEVDELAAERAEILSEAAALKKSAADYMHPEVGVIATDPTVFGRNYFNRYSAPQAGEAKKAPKEEETPEASQDLAAIKSLAAAVKGANLPSTKTTKLSSADTNVDATKKSASTVNLFGLSEEAF